MDGTPTLPQRRAREQPSDEALPEPQVARQGTVSSPAGQPIGSRPSKRTSIIWQHGKLVTEDGKQKYVCEQCGTRFPYSGSTSTMRYHLTHVHNIAEAAKTKPPTHSTPQQQEASPTPAPSHTSNPTERAMEQLLIFFATSHMPLSTLEQPRLAAMCESLCSTIEIPTPQSVRETILPNLVDRFRVLVRSLPLKDYFLSTERWIGNSNATFIGVSAHYIENWQLQTVMLDARYCDPLSDGSIHPAIIQESLTLSLEEGNVDVTAIRSITSAENPQNLSASSSDVARVPIFRCAIRLLQLALRAFLQAPCVKDLVNGVYYVVGMVNKTIITCVPKRASNSPVSVPRPCTTDWGGFHRMMSSFIRQWDALWEHHSDLMLSKVSRAQLDLITEISRLSKPFAEVHTDMQTDTEPILVHTLAQLCHIRNGKLPSDSVVCQAFSDSVLPYINSYVDSLLEYSMILGLCCLDPRYKTFSWISRDAEVVANTLARGKDWMETQLPREWTQDGPFGDTGQEDDSATQEMEQYFALSVWCRNKADLTGTQPLQWWKQHEAQFPRLAILAARWLALPASSVPGDLQPLVCECNDDDMDTLSAMEFIGRNSSLLHST